MKRLLLTSSLIAATVVPAYAGTEANLSGSANTSAEVTTQGADVSADASAMGDAKAATTPLMPATEEPNTAESNSDAKLDATLNAEADGPAMEPLDMNEITAAALTGAPAYDAKDEHIGEVSEVIVNTNGAVEALIVDVGGFLGLGEKPVELPMSDLMILEAEGDLRVSTRMSQDQLDGLPEYQGS